VVESFEDGDISEYSGNVAEFDVVDTSSHPVYDGSKTLRCTNNANFYDLRRTDVTVKQGETLLCYFYPDSGSGGFHIRWAVQGNNSWYGVQQRDGNDDATLRKDRGDLNPSKGVNWSQYYGQWNRLEVVWETDGTMAVTAYEPDDTKIWQDTGTDTKYTSGGIGFGVGSGGSSGTVYFDYYVIP